MKVSEGQLVNPGGTDKNNTTNKAAYAQRQTCTPCVPISTEMARPNHAQGGRSTEPQWMVVAHAGSRRQGGHMADRQSPQFDNCLPYNAL